MYTLANPTTQSQPVFVPRRVESPGLSVDVAAGPVAVGLVFCAAGVVHMSNAGQSVYFLSSVNWRACTRGRDCYILDCIAELAWAVEVDMLPSSEGIRSRATAIE